MKQQMHRRKMLIALAVIILSLGALGWQIADYQRRNAALQAALSEAPLLEWRAATDKERQAVLSSIKNQLEAFKRDDYQTAAKYQSKGLRQKFPDVKVFRSMMKAAYPQFARYKSVAFGSEQIDKSGKYFQVPATVIGADGVKVDALYEMILEDGLWRVSGVQDGFSPPKPNGTTQQI